MGFVKQYLSPEAVLAQLEDKHRGTFADLAEISDAALSLFLSAKRGLSIPMQCNMIRVLEFYDWMAQNSAFPVDFSDADRLRPHFQKFLRARDEAEVIRASSETALK